MRTSSSSCAWKAGTAGATGAGGAITVGAQAASSRLAAAHDRNRRLKRAKGSS